MRIKYALIKFNFYANFIGNLFFGVITLSHWAKSMRILSLSVSGTACIPSAYDYTADPCV